MRVVGGTARGTRLVAPKGLDVRPTLDRVRESLFNILAPHVEGARFLDLFAGTGAMGIEALSRGAASCVFVESDRRSLDAITHNLEAAKVGDRAHVCRATLPGDWALVPTMPERYDIVFADPPYAYRKYNELFGGLEKRLKPEMDGIFVLEHSSRTEVIFPQEVMTCYRHAVYGEAALSFFHLTHYVVSDRL